MKKTLPLFLICILICCGAHAQRTEVYNPHIHTVQVIANNDYMAPAVIRLGEGETVEISRTITIVISMSSHIAMQTGPRPTFPKQNTWMVSMIIR